MRHRAAFPTHSDSVFADWGDVNSAWWLSLCLLMMIALISFGCNKLPYRLLCLSLLLLAPCHRHHRFASVCFRFIGLLTVPSIFFKKLTAWHLTLLSSQWFYSLQDGCLKPLEFCPRMQIALSFHTEGSCKLVIAKYGSVEKSLSASIQVQEGTNIWATNTDKQLQTVIPGVSCENSPIVALT